MICKRCGEERFETADGICILCHAADKRVENPRGYWQDVNIRDKKGFEVKSKTGKIDENSKWKIS